MAWCEPSRPCFFRLGHSRVFSMNRVPKRAASPTLSDFPKKSSPEFSATRASMTSMCELQRSSQLVVWPRPKDDKLDVILQVFFLQIKQEFRFSRIGLPHLPVTEPTPDVLEDVASVHGLADFVFVYHCRSTSSQTVVRCHCATR